MQAGSIGIKTLTEFISWLWDLFIFLIHKINPIIKSFICILSSHQPDDKTRIYI